jgi:hypothetical protein
MTGAYCPACGPVQVITDADYLPDKVTCSKCGGAVMDEPPAFVATLIERVEELEREDEISACLIDIQSTLLTGVVNAIRGLPKPLHLHSHHDAIELTENVVNRVTELERALSKVRYCKKHGGPLPISSSLCKMCEGERAMIEQAVKYSVLEEKYLELTRGLKL